jgi:hypothetical protein
MHPSRQSRKLIQGVHQSVQETIEQPNVECLGIPLEGFHPLRVGACQVLIDTVRFDFGCQTYCGVGQQYHPMMLLIHHIPIKLGLHCLQDLHVSGEQCLFLTTRNIPDSY